MRPTTTSVSGAEQRGVGGSRLCTAACGCVFVAGPALPASCMCTCTAVFHAVTTRPPAAPPAAYTTIELFAASLTAKTKTKGLLEILANASGE